MAAEVIVVSVLALLVGAGIGYIFKDPLAKLINKKQRDKNKIINNPDLLVEKLNENGKMVDGGEELRYSVEDDNGKKKVVLEKKGVKEASVPKPAAPQALPLPPASREGPKDDKVVVEDAQKEG